MKIIVLNGSPRPSGNTKAMISNLKSLHRSQCRDSQVAILSQKILDCGNAHIQQFQHYL